jgi:DNA (cytosine-5)-methyltransferase 1
MRRTNLDLHPCPTIAAGGVSNGSTSQYWLEVYKGASMKSDASKPVYRVLSMKQIKALPWNGFKVVSTFSGCGGSCTGFRMAGFKVVWANEFVPSAQESYKANAAADCYLDCRDIKLVQPEDIFKSTGLKVGELDLFDGSPPCQSFSTAGKREKGWGKNKKYEHGATQKNETLFDEYIRLLRGLKPKVFVAENVSGLIKGTAKGYFLDILAAMKASGYRVACRLLDAQWLGVPQQRQRVIFIGVREDLNLEPVHPKPLPYRYSVRDALPWIDTVIQDPKGQFAIQTAGSNPCFSIKAGSAYHCSVREAKAIPLPPSRLKSSFIERAEEDNRPCHSVTTDDSFRSRGIVKRKFTIAELKRIRAFPDDFILCGSYAQQWERLGNSVPPVMACWIGKTIRDEVLGKIPAVRRLKQQGKNA